MKIRLLMDLPVDKNCGMTKDRELEVVKDDTKREYKNRAKQLGVWVVGDNGENVKVLLHEYEVVNG